MRTSKKLLSTIMALMIAVTMVMAFPAAASAATGSITVSPPNSSLTLAAGDFSVYKVFDLSYVAGPPESYAYTPVADYSGFTADDPDAAIVWAWMNENPRVDLTPSGLSGTLDAAMVTLSQELWKFIEDSHGAIAPVSADNELSGGKVTISGLDPGYYLVHGGGNAAGNVPPAVGSVCILISVTDGNDSAMALKADAPTIDKWVFDPDRDPTTAEKEAGKATGDNWVKWTDNAVKDDVWFKLTSQVPDMKGYKSYTFTVHDKMDPGLAFNDDVTVYVNGALYSGDNYKVVTSGLTDGCTFEIVFDPDEFIKLTAGDSIVVSFSATLDFDNAVIYKAHNDNTVYLEYSNNPKIGGEGETGDTPDDNVWVYTYYFDVFKYTGDLEDSPQALQGAEFALFKTQPTSAFDAEDQSTWAAFKPVGFTDNGSAYRYDPDSTAYKFTSDANGKIRLEGLDEGTYYLVETTAPEGFNRLTGAQTVTISNDTGDRMVLNTSETEHMMLNSAAVDTVNVENNTGTEFPGTGGIGRTVFVLGGSVLMLGALAAMFIRRRISD